MLTKNAKYARTRAKHNMLALDKEQLVASLLTLWDALYLQDDRCPATGNEHLDGADFIGIANDEFVVLGAEPKGEFDK